MIQRIDFVSLPSGGTNKYIISDINVKVFFIWQKAVKLTFINRLKNRIPLPGDMRK